MQISGEGNVISTNGMRMEWEASEQIILSVHSLVQFQEVEIRCAHIFPPPFCV